MKNTSIILLGIVISLFLFSCGNKEKSGELISTDTIIKTVSPLEAANVIGKYGIKSGIVYMKIKTMGFEQDINLYFDDYGNKEMTDANVNIMGIKSHQLIITDSNNVWNLDVEKKTGTKTNIHNIKKSSDINFNVLTDEDVKMYNLKKLGQAEILNKGCDVYSIKSTQMEGKFYIWKGLPLKSEVSAMNMKSTVEVTKIDENANISPDKFKIPEGYNITEINADSTAVSSTK